MKVRAESRNGTKIRQENDFLYLTGCIFLIVQRGLEYDEQEVWHHHYGLEPFRLWAEAALWVHQGEAYSPSLRQRRKACQGA